MEGALSSAVERRPYKAEVGGSKPPAPTKENACLQPCRSHSAVTIPPRRRGGWVAAPAILRGSTKPNGSAMRFIHVQKERVVGAESEPVTIEGDRLSDLYRWYADNAVRLA